MHNFVLQVDRYIVSLYKLHTSNVAITFQLGMALILEFTITVPIFTCEHSALYDIIGIIKSLMCV